MKLISIIIFAFLINGLSIAQEMCDSISFYANGKIAYLKTSKGYYNSTYSWHPNGHIKSQTLNNYYGYHRIDHYEDGSVTFDSVTTNSSIFCEYFYENGLLQKRILEHKPQSEQFETEPSYSYYEFDRDGEVSQIIKRDDKGKEVVNEMYPFKKFKSLKHKTAFYDNKTIQQFGYYDLNEAGDTLKFGVWFNFYSNGQLSHAGLYYKNNPWGLHLSYDSLGNISDRKYFFKGAEANNTDLKTNSNEPFIQDQYKNIDGIFDILNSYKNKETAYFFYRGLALCEVPNPLASIDSNYLGRTTFPLFEYYSRSDYYEFNYHKPWDLYREMQMINGQVAYKYESNGKLKTKIYTHANNTPKYNSPIVNLDLEERKENLRSDSTSHLFVTLPTGNRIEILDRYLAINGYWEFISDSGNKLFEGDYYNGQQGKWIEYFPRTGIPKVIQNFHLEDHTSLAKGKYKEFYPTGGKKKIGKYNAHRKQTGIWKGFTEKGQTIYRARLINDKEYGLVLLSTGQIKRNGKEKIFLVLYWNGHRLFRPKRNVSPYPKF